jgi:hypothetical protein
LELLQLQSQQPIVPTSIQCNAVVGQDVRLLLGIAQVAELNHRNLFEAELSGCGQTTVTSDQAMLTIGEDGVVESELGDRGRYLCHLLIAVRAGIASIRDQVIHRCHPNFRMLLNLRHACSYNCLHRGRQ